MTRKPDLSRWRFFIGAAEESVSLASKAPTREWRRLWLEQASWEIARAHEARFGEWVPS
jgi:cell division protein FtsL